MKKDKLWVKFKIREELESWQNTEGGIDEDGINYVLNIIDQLEEPEEPEVLSQKWIGENVEYAYFNILDGSERLSSATAIIRPKKLQNLVVPKKELPVIPQWVADSIESKKRVGTRLNVAMSEFPEFRLEKELGIDEHECNELYARAWLDGYEVEEEPLYFAMIKGHEMMTDKGDWTFKYWKFDTSNGDVFPSHRFTQNGNFLILMSKVEWSKLGINDSNADFVKLKEEKK